MEVETVPAAEDEARLTRLRFDAAVKVIKSLPPDGPFQPSNDMMLKFYSYYKQATVGACNIPRPGFWDAVGKAKWDAWNSLGDMSKEAAMAAYVDEMKLILEGMPMTDEVEELLRVLGPFYELVDEKKKITQISDLSSGLGSVMNSMQSKSFAKSIVRNMEMNGTLETRPPRPRPREVKEHSDEEVEEEEEEEEEEAEEDDDDEEEAEEEEEVKKDKKAEARKKASSRSHKAPLSNGKVANGGAHLTNGAHQQEVRAAAAAAAGGHAQLNGHHAEQSVGPAHIASDSDSEVYCDSVDQFGQDETSERLGSRDDLEEEEEEGGGEQQAAAAAAPASGSEDLQDPPHLIRCGGEDGDVGGSAMSQRRRLNVERQDASLRRGGRGSRSPGGGGGGGSGPLAPLRGGGDDGDGDGGAWGGGGGGGSLNEQIVVALARLQDDMQSVLQRLHTLEALTATQARSAALSPVYASAPVTKKKNRNPSWWPFDLSPSSLVLAVVWPFVVQWLIRLFLQRRRRRIN